MNPWNLRASKLVYILSIVMNTDYCSTKHIFWQVFFNYFLGIKDKEFAFIEPYQMVLEKRLTTANLII